MGNAKGTLFVHLREYIREAEGDDAWARVLAALPPEDRALYDGVLLPSSFYPVGALNHAVDAFMRDRPNPRLTMQQIASHTATRDIPTLYKVLMKLGSVESILRRSDSVWRRYFEHGGVEAVLKGPKHFELLLAAPTEPDTGPGPLICSVAVPTWWYHGFKIMRVAATMVHDRCRFDAGTSACRLTVRW